MLRFYALPLTYPHSCHPFYTCGAWQSYNLAGISSIITFIRIWFSNYPQTTQVEPTPVSQMFLKDKEDTVQRDKYSCAHDGTLKINEQHNFPLSISIIWRLKPLGLSCPFLRTKTAVNHFCFIAWLWGGGEGGRCDIHLQKQEAMAAPNSLLAATSWLRI